MPGEYGPGGRWIHDRAHRIMEEGKTREEYGQKKGKQVAYAVATQQAHSLGKSPKDFRTSKGVQVAKKKYPDSSEYRKTADNAAVSAFFDELSKLSFAVNTQPPPQPGVAPAIPTPRVSSKSVGIGKSSKPQGYTQSVAPVQAPSQVGESAKHTPPPPVNR